MLSVDLTNPETYLASPDAGRISLNVLSSARWTRLWMTFFAADLVRSDFLSEGFTTVCTKDLTLDHKMLYNTNRHIHQA